MTEKTFTLRIVQLEKVRAQLHPGEAYRADAFLEDGGDFHALGATAEEAAMRLIAFMHTRGAL